MRLLSLAILLGLLTATDSLSQATDSTAVSTQKTKRTFDPSGKIYNKHTGKKISDQEFAKYIQNDPRVSFEEVVNEYGEVEKYLLDTTTRQGHRLTEANQPKTDNTFPKFVFESIDGETLSSTALLGKWVLLRFEVFLPMIHRPSIAALDQQISDAPNRDDIAAISCFLESKSELRKQLNLDLENIRVVADAQLFHSRYNITRMPTTILIDPEGKLVRYYYADDKIDLGVTGN